MHMLTPGYMYVLRAICDSNIEHLLNMYEIYAKEFCLTDVQAQNGTCVVTHCQLIIN